MRSFLTIKALLLAQALLTGITLSAQNSFTHGPDQGIEAGYFDQNLAPFYHGVASGDPLQDRVIIWTRVTPTTDTVIPVSWKMATDTSFQHIVATGELTTDYTKDYTVKVDVTGLEPNVTYYYYFTALEKNSLIGRTHTLQGSNVEHLRFAVGSCSNYQMGYFNAYKRISEYNDLDAVLHLGDYIYEYPTYGYGYTVEVDREHRPNDEIITLDDYRIRHSFYKLDQDLRAAHQQQPFICIWDDHEIANNTYENGAANHDEETEGDFQTRKESAIRAYLEWMPIRTPEYVGGKPQIHRTFNISPLADIIMIDTRVEDRDKQAYSAADPLFQDTTREILGEEQREWFFDQLDNTASTWKIIGNQVLMSAEGENSPDVDSWTGYPNEREKVFDHMLSSGEKNYVVLTGDSHRAWAFDLAENPYDTSLYVPLTGIGTFGVEFASSSFASPNRDESNPGTTQDAARQALLVENPHLRYTDQDNHGYFILDITPAKTQADYHFVDTKFRSQRDSLGDSWYTNVNQGYLQKALEASVNKHTQAIPAPENPPAYQGGNTAGIEDHSNLIVSGVYPNPATEYIMLGLILNTSEHVKLILSGIDGEIVLENELEMTAGNQKVKLLVPQDLVAGTYLLTVLTESHKFTKRVSIL